MGRAKLLRPRALGRALALHRRARGRARVRGAPLRSHAVRISQRRDRGRIPSHACRGAATLRGVLPGASEPGRLARPCGAVPARPRDQAGVTMPETSESRTFALGMVLVAWLVGLAVHVDTALALVTAALAVCLAATLLPPIAVVESLSTRAAARLVAVAVAIQVAALVVTASAVAWAIGLVGVLALAQILDLRRLRAPLIVVTCAVFGLVASVIVRSAYQD